jgi:hypothetical protein
MEGAVDTHRAPYTKMYGSAVQVKDNKAFYCSECCSVTSLSPYGMGNLINQGGELMSRLAFWSMLLVKRAKSLGKTVGIID